MHRRRYYIKSWIISYCVIIISHRHQFSYFSLQQMRRSQCSRYIMLLAAYFTSDVSAVSQYVADAMPNTILCRLFVVYYGPAVYLLLNKSLTPDSLQIHCKWQLKRCSPHCCPEKLLQRSNMHNVHHEYSSTVSDTNNFVFKLL